MLGWWLSVVEYLCLGNRTVPHVALGGNLNPSLMLYATKFYYCDEQQ